MQSKQLAIAVAAAFAVAAPAFAAGDFRSQSAQDTTSKSSESSAQVHSSTAVRDAQQALKDKGYDTGPVDGIMGPKTSAAVKEFQQSQGLRTSGQLDSQTLSALDVQSSGMTRSGQTSGSMNGPTRSSDATSPSPSSTQSGKTTSPSPSQGQSSGAAPGTSSERPVPSRPGDAPSRSSDATSPSPSSTQSGKTDPAARPGG